MTQQNDNGSGATEWMENDMISYRNKDGMLISKEEYEQLQAEEQAAQSERGQTAAVQHMDEAAQQPDIGRGLVKPVIYAPDENGNLVEATAEEPAEEKPFDPIAAAVINTLQEAMKRAEIEDTDSWLATLENGIFTPGITEPHCIFLVNRALRLLILERRDADEADRNVALTGLVDGKAIMFWLPAIEKVVLPFFKQYGVGVPGIKFKEGEEPAWFLASNPKTQNSSVSDTTEDQSAVTEQANENPLNHGNTEFKPEEVEVAAVATASGNAPVASAAPCSTDPV